MAGTLVTGQTNVGDTSGLPTGTVDPTTSPTNAPKTGTSTFSAAAPAPTTDPAPAVPAPQATTPLPGLTADQQAGLTGDEQNAFEAVYATLQTFGLESLANTLYQYSVQNFDGPTVSYLIQQTNEWKTRFAGNEMLKKQGLAPLQPDQYLSVEQQYQNALTAAGIPAGQYGRSDFANWIGGSVSANEIQQRTQLAAQWVNNNDPAFLQALQQYHGITHGDMVGYALDQSRSMPYLNLVSQQAQVGGSALRAGLHADAGFANQLGTMVLNGDMSQRDVDQGYSQIGQTLPRLQDLAKLSGKQFDQTSAEQATFLGNPDAMRTQLSLVQQEQARFAGSPGMGSNFYHPAYGVGRDLEGTY